MRLEPLYRLRFAYPESWDVELEGGWRQWFFIAEGRAEGSISVGEVRSPTDPDGEPELVVDIAELVWEPIAE